MTCLLIYIIYIYPSMENLPVITRFSFMVKAIAVVNNFAPSTVGCWASFVMVCFVSLHIVCYKNLQYYRNKRCPCALYVHTLGYEGNTLLYTGRHFTYELTLKYNLAVFVLSLNARNHLCIYFGFIYIYSILMFAYIIRIIQNN